MFFMIDCEDTETSKDNHGHVWNTWKTIFVKDEIMKAGSLLQELLPLMLMQLSF